MIQWAKRIITLVAVMTTMTTTLSAWAADDEVDFAAVVNTTVSMQQELEVIRLYFGRQATELRRFEAIHASNRHAFLLAQSIHRKLKILGEELTATSPQATPAAPNRAIEAADVLAVIERAHGLTLAIQTAYGLETAEQTEKAVSSSDSTQAVEAMIEILRQVNLMLDKQYRPQDVYEQIDLATVYAAGVLKNQGKTEYPAIEFVPNKQPIDVFQKLLDCAELNAAIAEVAGVEALKINSRSMRRSNTRLSSNYDLATILLSDVAVWTEQLEGADDVFPEERSIRYTTPSHVYQKASQLEAQMKQIQAAQ